MHIERENNLKALLTVLDEFERSSGGFGRFSAKLGPRSDCLPVHVMFAANIDEVTQ